MIYKILPALLFLTTLTFPSLEIKESKKVADNQVVATEPTAPVSLADVAYSQLTGSAVIPNRDVFAKAFQGYQKLKAQGSVSKDIVTVIDFTQSSNTKRLWVIDLAANKILFHSLVAHGRNTGNEFAKKFSNVGESYMSSLGFYATGEIYHGKHGLSLRLDGLQKQLNGNARNRAIVMHGADYVSEQFIKQHSRLGRSLGCPALPRELTPEIIKMIAGKSLLFIYHPDADNEINSLLS